MLLLKSKPAFQVNDRLFPSSFQSAFNALFDEATLPSDSFSFSPATDLIENEKDYEIRMSLPGIKKEDVKIALEGDYLTVEGERKQVSSEEKSKHLKREISYGKFSRSFKIGQVEMSAIDARFEHGLLLISLPKKAEERAKLIEIK